MTEPDGRAGQEAARLISTERLVEIVEGSAALTPPPMTRERRTTHPPVTTRRRTRSGTMDQGRPGSAGSGSTATSAPMFPESFVPAAVQTPPPRRTRETPETRLATLDGPADRAGSDPPA